MTTLLCTIASSSRDLSHRVSLGSDGVVWCSCESWRYQKVAAKYRTCKHMEEASRKALAGELPNFPQEEAARILAQGPAKRYIAKAVTRASKEIRSGSKETALNFLTSPYAKANNSLAEEARKLLLGN